MARAARGEGGPIRRPEPAMRPASPFTAVAAVEGWDAWFRWRDAAGLRDRTIEATWWRVARAAAAAEGAQAEAWARRFFDAFAQWRLLPDEDLLRAAGTGQAFAPDGSVRATLDVAAFVAPAGVDLERIADTAALAVRLLDDALLALRPDLRARTGLRIGLLGLGDALHSLGLAYDGDDALRLAGNVAAALARGARPRALEKAPETPRDGDQPPTRPEGQNPGG
jgi:ribonucleoside-diphosphate reductase alpha chain